VLAKDKQFLLLIRHTPCYSYTVYLPETIKMEQLFLLYEMLKLQFLNLYFCLKVENNIKLSISRINV